MRGFIQSELFANPLAADTLIHEAKKAGIKIVLCNHDFQKNTIARGDCRAVTPNANASGRSTLRMTVMPQDADRCAYVTFSNQ